LVFVFFENSGESMTKHKIFAAIILTITFLCLSTGCVSVLRLAVTPDALSNDQIRRVDMILDRAGIAKMKISAMKIPANSKLSDSWEDELLASFRKTAALNSFVQDESSPFTIALSIDKLELYQIGMTWQCEIAISIKKSLPSGEIQQLMSSQSHRSMLTYFWHDTMYETFQWALKKAFNQLNWTTLSVGIQASYPDYLAYINNEKMGGLQGDGGFAAFQASSKKGGLDFEISEQLQLDLIKKKENTYGKNSPELIPDYMVIMNLYLENDMPKVPDIVIRIVSIIEKNGKVTTTIEYTFNILVETCEKIGDDQLTEKVLQRISIFYASQKTYHFSSYIESRRDLCSFYYRKGKYQTLFKEGALLISELELKFGSVNQAGAEIRLLMANANVMKEDYVSAGTYFAKCIEDLNKVFPSGDISIADAYYDYANCLFQQGQYSNSLRYLTESKALFIIYLGQTNAKTKECSNMIAICTEAENG
jgi:tetratricopeptide (TPR) repeat protein